MKRTRKLHLWIGLITSLLLFLEVGSGLLLTERWIMSGGSRTSTSHEHTAHSGVETSKKLSMTDAIKKASETGAFNLDKISVVMNHGAYIVVLNDAKRTTITISPDGKIIGKESNGFAAFVRGLHVGQIGQVNIKWVLDIVSISLLFLTGTGIYLSLKIIRAKKRRPKKPIINAA